jgi:hypothetical protein
MKTRLLGWIVFALVAGYEAATMRDARSFWAGSMSVVAFFGLVLWGVEAWARGKRS